MWHAQILELMRGTKEVEAELADIKDAVMESNKHKGSLRLFTQRRHIPQLLFSILIPVFQQFTGINAFIFYGARLQFPSLLSLLRIRCLSKIYDAPALSEIGAYLAVCAVMGHFEISRKVIVK